MAGNTVSLGKGVQVSSDVFDEALVALNYLEVDTLEELLDLAMGSRDFLSENARKEVEFVKLFEDGVMDDSMKNIILTCVVEECGFFCVVNPLYKG